MTDGYELGREIYSEGGDGLHLKGRVCLGTFAEEYDAVIGENLIALPRGTLQEIGRGNPSGMRYVMGQIDTGSYLEGDVEKFLLRALIADLESQKKTLISKTKPEDL